MAYIFLLNNPNINQIKSAIEAKLPHNTIKICINSKIAKNFSKGVSLSHFIKQFIPNNIITKKEKIQLIMKITSQNSISITPHHVNSFCEYIKNYLDIKLKNQKYEEILQLYNNELIKKSKIDEFLYKETIYCKMLEFITNSNENYAFIGEVFENKVKFNFFSNIIKLVNINIFFISNPKNNSYFIEKNLQLCIKNNINCQSINIDCKIANIKIQDFNEHFAKYNALLQNIKDTIDSKIAIIVSSIEESILINALLKQQNIPTFCLHEKNEKTYFISNILDLICNKIDFKNKFIALLIKYSTTFNKDKAMVLNFNQKLMQSEIVNYNIILQDAESFFEDVDIKKLIYFIKNINVKGNINEVLENYNNIFSDIDLDLTTQYNFQYSTFQDLKNILSLLLYNEVLEKEYIYSDARVFILSRIDARFMEFDNIFFLDINFHNNEVFTELNEMNKNYYFTDISNILYQAKSFTIFYTNNDNILSLKSYLLVKHGIILKNIYKNFETTNNYLKNLQIESPKIYPSDLPKKISYTAINLYLENPYEFYIKYVLNLKQDEIGSAEIGNIFHEIMSFMVKRFTTFNEINQLNIDTNIATFINQDCDNILCTINNATNDLIIKLQLENFIKMIRNLMKEVYLKNGKIITEKSFQSEILINNENITITAKPDLLVIYNDFFEIYDLKTGQSDHNKKTIKKEINHKTPQLLMYSSIIAKNIIQKSQDFGYIYFNKDCNKIVKFSEFLSEKNNCHNVNIFNQISNFERFLNEILIEIYNPEGVIFKNTKDDGRMWYFSKI